MIMLYFMDISISFTTLVFETRVSIIRRRLLKIKQFNLNEIIIFTVDINIAKSRKNHVNVCSEQNLEADNPANIGWPKK